MLQTKTKVYKLDAQVLAKAWAGQKVKLVGALDPKTNTIAVDKIEREGTSPGSSSPISSTIAEVCPGTASRTLPPPFEDGNQRISMG